MSSIVYNDMCLYLMCTYTWIDCCVFPLSVAQELGFPAKEPILYSKFGILSTDFVLCYLFCIGALESQSQQFETAVVKIRRKYWWKNIKVVSVNNKIWEWYQKFFVHLLGTLAVSWGWGFFVFSSITTLLGIYIYMFFIVLDQIWMHCTN